MAEIVPPRGMRDVLPEDFSQREGLIRQIRQTYESFGYLPMDTPAPERIEYLSRKSGSETEQLMFKILSRGPEDEGTAHADMALRYDLTVALCRFYASNHHKLPRLFRRCQIGPVWRAERPQRGRLREFYQCDIDLVGEPSIFAECELILATDLALKRLDIGGHFVKLSDRRLLPTIFQAMSLSDAEIRKAMVTIDKLDKVGVLGVVQEASGYLSGEKARSFSRFVERISNLSPGTAALSETLGEEGQRCAGELEPILANLRRITEIVQSSAQDEIEICFWPALARGMAYYTGPIFEVWNRTDPFSLAGGGRYDGLVGQFLARSVPACGFSIGFERILTILKDRESQAQVSRPYVEILLIARDEGMEGQAFRLASELRAAGHATEVHPYARDAKRAFKHAEDLGIPWILNLSRQAAELTRTATRERFKGEVLEILDTLAGSR